MNAVVQTVATAWEWWRQRAPPALDTTLAIEHLVEEAQRAACFTCHTGWTVSVSDE